MDPDDKQELQALVVGFLQQTLKENPQGLTVQEFERFLPERCDEPRDWYKRYGVNSTLDALEHLKDTVRVTYNSRYNCTYISLDQTSDKVDSHLVDLITNQKTSGKRKPIGRPSSRVFSSFYGINRQYSGPNRQPDRPRFRMNSHDIPRRSDSNNIFRKCSPPPQAVAPPSRPTVYSQVPTSRMATNDPRKRISSSSSSHIAPQIKYPPSTPQRPSENFEYRHPSVPTPAPVPKPTAHDLSMPAPINRVTSAREPAKVEDPILIAKKSHLCQKIVSLLARKFPEIKILHLTALFKLDYNEEINPKDYGYDTLTHLIQDPILSEDIQLKLRPFPTISSKAKITPDGKENIAFVDSLKEPEFTDDLGALRQEPMGNLRSRWNAVEPFNVAPMLQSLEPIGEIRTPPIVKNLNIDDAVKYKTMRMIYRSPGQKIKLDDWETLFEQESRLKITITEYGCKTFLEFFRKLAQDLPLKIRLEGDEWIAYVDLAGLSKWLREQMARGKYRAITSIESHYELIAFPNDKYKFYELKDVQSGKHEQAVILSARRANQVWLQVRTAQFIESHLCVEASLTCYEDYDRKKLIKLPAHFVKPGFPCAVFDKQTLRWCRALVIQAPEKIDRDYDIRVILVDYGKVKSFPVSGLKCLMKNHLKSPVGMVCCKLSGIQDENDPKVNLRVRQVLQEYTNPPVTLACKFLSTSPAEDSLEFMPKHNIDVEIIDSRNNKDTYLAHLVNRSDLPLENE